MVISSEFNEFAEKEISKLSKKDKIQIALILNNIQLCNLRAILFHYGKCKTRISSKILRIDVSIKQPKLYELINFICTKSNNIMFIICNCVNKKSLSCDICDTSSYDEKMIIECKKVHTRIIDIIHQNPTNNPGNNIIYCRKNMDNEYHIATDGACIGNGKKHARAAFAYYIPQSVLGDSSYKHGELTHDILYNYNINNCTCDEFNEDLKQQTKNIIENTTSLKDMFINLPVNVKPSNIRAELMAIFHALLFINKINNDLINQNVTKIKLITDSEFSINVFTKWIGGWIKGNKFAKKANLDIIIPTYVLLNKIDKIKIEFVHINSHLTKEQKKALNEEQAKFSYWNEIADQLATKVLEE